MNKIRHLFYGILVILAVMAGAVVILRAWRAEAKRQYSVPILMYHEIGATENSPWCVPTEIFRAQMACLREQGFRTILPSDLAAHRRWGKPLPRKPVLLTFDDGYSSISIVEPILKEHGFRAIIYLITDQVAETAAERRSYEGKECLVWPEALAMQQRRTFVFGGHSHVHNNLAVDNQAAGWIAECYRQLKLHGICDPYSFCYPHGQQNQATRQLVRAAGFQTAVVCEDALAVIGPSADLFALPRVSVMGGRHEFKFINKRYDPGEQKLYYRILHTGIPLEISAGLRESPPEKEQWLPPREVKQEEFELCFPLTNGTLQNVRTALEIRDKHRLFKLAVIDQ